MAQTDEQFWILAALAFVAMTLILVVRRLMQGKPETLPPNGPLRLLVRPLKELRPDPNHLYLGTTISRELTASLKAFERIEPSLGDALSSLYIDGTVRKTGPRVVMHIRLMSGRHSVWAGTYDGAINDLPHMQNEIVSNVVRTLNVSVRKTRAHSAPTEISTDLPG